jgi:hypothetical protein
VTFWVYIENIENSDFKIQTLGYFVIHTFVFEKLIKFKKSRKNELKFCFVKRFIDFDEFSKILILL